MNTAGGGVGVVDSHQSENAVFAFFANDDRLDEVPDRICVGAWMPLRRAYLTLPALQHRERCEVHCRQPLPSSTTAYWLSGMVQVHTANAGEWEL